MCTITGEFKQKSFTGYKVALKKGKSYLSPATGIRYKVGAVTIVRKKRKNSLPTFVNMLLFSNHFYNPRMVGKTGVFMTKDEGDYWLQDFGFTTQPWMKSNNCKLVLLKMTISGDMLTGKYGSTPTVIGSRIDKIKEL